MAKSGQSSKSPKYIHLIISTIHLGGVLDIVTVLIKSAFGETTLSPVWCSYENPATRKDQALPPLCGGPLPLEPRAASLFSLLDFS